MKKQLTVERQSIDGWSENSDRNNCTVIATAIVTGLPYPKVRDAFSAAGRRHGRGCKTSVQQAAWAILGYRWIRTDHSERARTLITLQRYLERYDDTLPLLVYVSRHLTAFVATRAVEHLAPTKRIGSKGTGRLEKFQRD